MTRGEQMSSQPSHLSQVQHLKTLRRLGFWLPVTAIGCMTLLIEGLTHYFGLPWSVDLAFDVLMFSAIAVGAYLFSHYVFGIVEQKEAELRNSREQLRALARHLQSVREEERSRIAREVHDTLGQPLAALKIDLAWLAAQVPTDRASWQERIRATLALIDSTIRSVRQIMMDLRPSLLDDLGLTAAVEWEAQEFQKRTGIRCEFVPDQPELALPAEIGTAVFRICQEALTNIARHAGATHASIRLRQDSGFLLLSVADNGRGITDGEIAAQSSLGLLDMRERALRLGGHLGISAQPGKGTTVTLRLPLPTSSVEANVGRHVSGEASPPG